jgi:hypothetical protein
VLRTYEGGYILVLHAYAALPPKKEPEGGLHRSWVVPRAGLDERRKIIALARNRGRSGRVSILMEMLSCVFLKGHSIGLAEPSCI